MKNTVNVTTQNQYKMCNKFEQELIDNGICPSCRGDLQVSISTIISQVEGLHECRDCKDHERS